MGFLDYSLRAALVSFAVPLAAQSLWLPASDPVGIARSGTGVAFGRSLEAAALNPSLLVTLKDRYSTYAGLGMDMYASQHTTAAIQQTLYSSDRNRLLPALGGAWRCTESFALGIKLDSPFMHHVELPQASSYRFVGRTMDLNVKRAELQAAMALTPNVSVGVGVGLARLSYGSSVCLRHVLSASDLLEAECQQKGTLLTPTWSAGFRWAIDPRWTIGGAYQHAISGKMGMTASSGALRPAYYESDGITPLPGVAAGGQEALSSARYLPGDGELELPMRATLGVRHRLSQYLTWEVDLYTMGRVMRLPSAPSMRFGTTGVTGQQSGITTLTREKSFALGVRAMAEFQLTKLWTLRGGFSLDPANQPTDQVNPLMVGSSSASFSAGAGYKIWGGELSAGYQYRQAQDVDSYNIHGRWTASGYQPTHSLTRVEGMGHLWAIGFKRGF